MTDSTLLEGIISIQSAIDAKKRRIEQVFIEKEKIEKRDRKAIRFLSLIKEKGIDFTLCTKEFINSICEGTSHGGFAAYVSERTYTDFSSLIGELSQSKSYATFLDGVEDPFNFGYSIRNLFAFGCRHFIVPSRNWMSSANVVAKSSAGASELCEIATVDDDKDAVKLLKENDICLVCSALSSKSVPLFEFTPPYPFVLFIGGEKRGISKDFMDNADYVVHIPYSNNEAKYSLPTASCAAIFGSYLSNIK